MEQKLSLSNENFSLNSAPFPYTINMQKVMEFSHYFLWLDHLKQGCNNSSFQAKTLIHILTYRILVLDLSRINWQLFWDVLCICECSKTRDTVVKSYHTLLVSISQSTACFHKSSWEVQINSKWREYMVHRNKASLTSCSSSSKTSS